MKDIEWARMSAPQLRALASRDGALALLPLGALEQHGPHLPVITDTANASEAALRAARLVCEEMAVAVLPGLWLGMSEHHLPFGGTITLDYETLVKMLRCVVRSLKSLGFSRLLIVNGHGGNVTPLGVAVRELAVEFSLPIVACTPWMLAAQAIKEILDVDDGVHHGCEAESSVMLALMPEAVQRDKFAEAYDNQTHLTPLPTGVDRFYSFAEWAPVTGSWGDPRQATARKGEEILTAQAHELVKIIRCETLWTPTDPVWNNARGQATTKGRLTI